MNDNAIRSTIRTHCQSIGLSMFGIEDCAALGVTFRILGREPEDAIKRACEFADTMAYEKHGLSNRLSRPLSVKSELAKVERAFAEDEPCAQN